MSELPVLSISSNCSRLKNNTKIHQLRKRNISGDNLHSQCGSPKTCCFSFRGNAKNRPNNAKKSLRINSENYPRYGIITIHPVYRVSLRTKILLLIPSQNCTFCTWFSQFIAWSIFPDLANFQRIKSCKIACVNVGTHLNIKNVRFILLCHLVQCDNSGGCRSQGTSAVHR